MQRAPDPYGAPALVWRLLTEQGLQHWRRYAVSFALMGLLRALGCSRLFH